TELHKRAIAYGMKDGGRVDGQNVFEVYEKVKEAVDYARENGPVLLEVITYRYKGHGVSDRSFDKRFAEELQEWVEQKDPINLLREHLIARYKNIEPELEAIEKQTQAVVEESVEFAKNSPEPDYE